MTKLGKLIVFDTLDEALQTLDPDTDFSCFSDSEKKQAVLRISEQEKKHVIVGHMINVLM